MDIFAIGINKKGLDLVATNYPTITDPFQNSVVENSGRVLCK